MISSTRLTLALSRWTATVEREAAGVVSEKVKRVVEASLKNWQGEQMPISRSWVDDEIDGLVCVFRTRHAGLPEK